MRTLEQPSPYTPAIAAPEGRGEAANRRESRYSEYFVGFALEFFGGWRRGVLYYLFHVLEVCYGVRPGGAIQSGSFLFEIFVKGAKVA
jgi:hypothetical protein